MKSPASPIRLLQALALIALTACKLPTTPSDTAERVAEAIMNGSDLELSELIDPKSPAARSSAQKLRIHFQGFSFKAEEEGTPLDAPSGTERTRWIIEASVAGTDRYQDALSLQIDCRKEPRRHCLVSGLDPLPTHFEELSSIEEDLSSQDHTPRVWLLTSLDVLDPRINLFTGRNHRVLAKAEELFREWAAIQAPDARAGIAHLVDQHQLARVLGDPRTRAVFWISHGTTGKVIDAQGFELAPVWTALALKSSARRIALVACQSQGILLREGQPDARVIDFAEKIDLTDGLEEALERTSSSDLEASTASLETQTESGESISLVRRLRPFDSREDRPSVIPAVRIEVGTEIVATLPGRRAGSHSAPGSASGDQSIEIRVPLLANRVILSSGESYTTPLTEIDLGQWEILTPGWKFFADSNGKPIGVTRNIVIRKPTVGANP